MMGITKHKFGNEHEMSINEFSHYSFFGSFRCIHLQQETTTSVWCSTCILVHSSSFPWSFVPSYSK
ncbi:unnamed protein product [Triticum turgidum subsp. durum]|uniref:Uncharacterized protein n=1 Tax=Triticum turgidum subsp. durum TaxID=4567 RepID=A0A9R0WYD6_TRITD|nr:unnamed protein product [Triticum turgidum subsp. durum]